MSAGASTSIPLLALLLSLASPAIAQRAAEPDIVIENVTVVSPERASPLPHASVVIRAGRIVEVSSNRVDLPHARHIDGRGRFLIPGLIDSHVHVGHSAALDDDAVRAHPKLWAAYRAQVPRAYLAFGFTTIVDLDATPGDRAWFSSTPLHPHFHSCGRGIKVAGGYGAFDVSAPLSPDSPNLVFEPLESSHWPPSLRASDFTAQKAVERSAQAGSMCVKAFVESGFGIFHWPYLHTETLRAVRAAATAHSLILMVHATSTASWREALDARADVIAHGLWIWPGSFSNPAPPVAAEEVIAAAARAHTYVQPTLQVVAGERAFLDPRLLDDPRLRYALPPSVVAYLRSDEGLKARASLLHEYEKASPAPGFERLLEASVERTHATFRVMLRDSVRIILGSDTPAGDGFGNPPGLNGRLEMQDWADAGAPLALILRAATLENATAMGLSRECGSIEVGKRADLLLLRENPLATISAYDAIETVFLDGMPIAPDTLRAPD